MMTKLTTKLSIADLLLGNRSSRRAACKVWGISGQRKLDLVHSTEAERRGILADWLLPSRLVAIGGDRYRVESGEGQSLGDVILAPALASELRADPKSDTPDIALATGPLGVEMGRWEVDQYLQRLERLSGLASFLGQIPNTARLVLIPEALLGSTMTSVDIWRVEIMSRSHAGRCS